MSSPALTPALTVGKRLVELCNAGQFYQAVTELYGPSIVSVEATAEPGQSPEVQGLPEVLKKMQWWTDNHEVHGSTTTGPFPHLGDRFAVIFEFDVTPKFGPMNGKRFTMQEVGVYTLKDSKIVREEFFYSM